MKVKNWMAEWLNEFSENTLRHSTVKRYKSTIQNYISPYIGEIEIEKVVQSDIRNLLYKEMPKNGLSASSVNTTLSVLREAFAVAEKNGMISDNVCMKVKRMKVVELPVEAFSRKEQKKIEDYILSNKKEKLYGIIICLYMSLRLGELLALTWDDVDFDNKTITVQKSLGQDNTISFPKTQAGIRVIPIPNNILSLIKALKKNSTCAYVIETKGHYTGMRGYQGLFERLLTKLNIDKHRFHSLRHTFATRAIESGMDIKTLSAIMGHENAMITVNRYAHCMLDEKRRALNKLSKLNG